MGTAQLRCSTPAYPTGLQKEGRIGGFLEHAKVSCRLQASVQGLSSSLSKGFNDEPSRVKFELADNKVPSTCRKPCKADQWDDKSVLQYAIYWVAFKELNLNYHNMHIELSIWFLDYGNLKKFLNINPVYNSLWGGRLVWAAVDPGLQSCMKR